MRSYTGRSITTIFVTGAILMLWGSASADMHPWDRETLALFSRLPIQDGGRIKPLDTYASFTLLQLRGSRRCPNLEGQVLTPIAWLLDCLFFPDLAKQYPVFRVENSEVIIAVGLQPKRKRDYYSYEELLTAREQLMMQGRQIMDTDSRRRTAMEREIVALAMNIRQFEMLTAFTGFAKEKFDVSVSEKVSPLFPGQDICRLSELLRKGPQILNAYMEAHRNRAQDDAEFNAIASLLSKVENAANDASALALFPPPVASDYTQWLSPKDMVEAAFSGEPVMVSQVNLLADFEALSDSIGNSADFKQKAAEFVGSTVQIAASRGEYRKIPLEVSYYRLKPFYYALVLYVLSFLVVACTWMRPQNKVLTAGAFLAVAAPTCLLLAGICMRSVIRGRPPVTSVYETILFVTFIAVFVALFIEWVNRQGLAVSLGAVLGAAGMFFANKYEAGYGGDTMPAMVAVLDTNFWLALHVTTIAIGYGAGFFASGLAHVFILGRLVGFRRSKPEFYRDVTRMVYGSLCFSFVFIALGTVLGGIWANESWGRFWGWDPKENGALMICLWQLTVLHARLDGMLKDHGVNISAVIGGIIIAFCWFGVNMLGVGLHSYGFTSGGYSALVNFYLFQTVIVMLGCFLWFRERKRESALLEE